jgi:hypothetical protein
MPTKTKTKKQTVSLKNVINNLTGDVLQMVSEIFVKSTQETYDREYTEIRETNDYNKFSFFESNRNIKISHVRKLYLLFKHKILDVPIKVDEKYRLLDGQHSFMARMMLGKPILYYISKEIKEEDIPMLNSNSKSWAWGDYLRSFVKRMNQNYIKYDNLWEEYNGNRKKQKPGKFNYKKIINHNEMSLLVLGYTSFTQQVKDIFYSGELKFNRDIDDVRKVLDFLYDDVLRELSYDLVSKRDFQTSLFTMYFHSNFDTDTYKKLIRTNKTFYNSEDFRDLSQGRMKRKIINDYNNMVDSDFKKITY